MANMHCTAYLGMSLDGFIAGPKDELDWLDELDHIEGVDYGYADFMASVDALVMGRRTFETVIGLVEEWPYDKPVLVMSRTLTELPDHATGCEIFAGTPAEVVGEAEGRGWTNLYIDGGKLASSFLNAGLLDELIVSVLPVALGEGVPVFGALAEHTWFDHISTESFDNGMIQHRYKSRSNT